jgi:hypothetical protein
LRPGACGRVVLPAGRGIGRTRTGAGSRPRRGRSRPSDAPSGASTPVVSGGLSAQGGCLPDPGVRSPVQQAKNRPRWTGCPLRTVHWRPSCMVAGRSWSRRSVTRTPWVVAGDQAERAGERLPRRCAVVARPLTRASIMRGPLRLSSRPSHGVRVGQSVRLGAQGLGTVPECRFHGLAIPRPRTRIPPHCATRPAHPSPRPADQLAKRLALPGTERIDLVPVEQHPERWTPRSNRQRRRGPCSHATAHGTRSRRQVGCWDDVVDRVRCARGQ